MCFNLMFHTAVQYNKKDLERLLMRLQRSVGTEEYVEKILLSAYEGKKKKIRQKYIIIWWIATHISVLPDLRLDLERKQDLFRSLWRIVFPGRKENDKKIALGKVDERGRAQIITTYESVLFELLKEAGTEKL